MEHSTLGLVLLVGIALVGSLISLVEHGFASKASPGKPGSEREPSQAPRGPRQDNTT